jgi:hypothetical protein
VPQGDLLKHNILLIPRYRKYLSQFLLISKWRGNENTLLLCNFRGCLAMQFSRKLRGGPQRADRADMAAGGPAGRSGGPVASEEGRWPRAVRIAPRRAPPPETPRQTRAGQTRAGQAPGRWDPRPRRVAVVTDDV